MGGEDADRGRGSAPTLQGPASPELAATVAATALPTSRRVLVPDAYASLARRVNLALAAFSAVHISYFIARFLVSSDPPRLHEAYVGQVHGGPFQAMDIFNGPTLTLARITLVASLFVVVSVWVSRHHPRNVIVQLVAASLLVAGQSSVAVAVLTSSETWMAPRIAAAA